MGNSFSGKRSISEKGFRKGTKCEVLFDEQWYDGTISKVYKKPNTNQIWVEVDFFKTSRKYELYSIKYNEQSGNIIMCDIQMRNKNKLNYLLPMNGCNSLIKQCTITKRVTHALNFYQKLNMESDDHKHQLITFCKESYTQILNDWTHFLARHNDPIKLEQLFDEIMSGKELNQCSSHKCLSMNRHLRDRNIDDCKQDNDNEYAFYQDLLDGIHCYIYHIWDMGLRIRSTEKTNVLVGNMRTMIQDKLPEIENQRYHNNKYNIATDSEFDGSVIFLSLLPQISTHK